MNTRLAIIRSEGKEHLCYREEGKRLSKYIFYSSFSLLTFATKK